MSTIKELRDKVKQLKKEEDFKGALEILEPLFQENQNSDEIKLELIETLFSYGYYLNDDWTLDYQGAIEVFKRILEIDPKNYRAFYNLGIAYHNFGNNKDALKSCDRALELKPDHKHCYYSKGVIYESMKKFALAMENYKKAKEIDPKFTYATHAIRDLLIIQENFADPGIQYMKIEKLKDLFTMSKKITIQMIQEILDISRTKLLEIILELGKNFQFKLDGDLLEINDNTLPEALDYLTGLNLED